MGSTRWGVLTLVAANLLPLAGVVWAGWDVGLVILFFWLENTVIGLYAMARMVVLDPSGAFWSVPFFTVHFGIFTAGHGLLLSLLLFKGPADALAALEADRLLVGAAVGALVVSHGYSFVTNFLVGPERRETNPQRPMGRAYLRVMVLHVTLVVGGFPVLALGEPIWAIALLVTGKLAVDALAHLAEHRQAPGSEPADEAPPATPLT